MLDCLLSWKLTGREIWTNYLEGSGYDFCDAKDLNVVSNYGKDIYGMIISTEKDDNQYPS
jgi:hypothetical protein